MPISLTPEQEQIRQAVREICADFPGEYWRQLDADQAYPKKFVDALTAGGWLAALIPEKYGGGGLGLAESCLILEEIHRSGGNAAACHAQMYIMGALLRHGSEPQKASICLRSLPASCAYRPSASRNPAADPTQRSSRRQPFDAAIATSSTDKRSSSPASSNPTCFCCSPARPRRTKSPKRTDGLSIFLIDLRDAVGNGLTVRPIRTMINHHTYELFFDGLEVPAENLVGEEGRGFRYILDGWNAERILIAAEWRRRWTLVCRSGLSLCR